MKRKVIIDTDPGIDDAVAIGMGLFSEKIDIVLMTTVSGNVSIEKTTNNLLKLEKFWDKKIPVAKGASQPLLRPAINASEVHGESGMDGYVFPEPDDKLLLDCHAVEAIYETLKESYEKITIVAIGPLTNIGLLLKMHPEVTEKIEEFIIMGGAINRGNVGIYSEFNIASDPEAANIVFESGVPIVLVSLEAGHQARIMSEDSQAIKQINQTGEMIHDLFKRYRGGSFETGIEMYDACAMAYLLEPDIFETLECFVGIEVCGAYTSGATLIDFTGILNQPHNCRVCIDVDGSYFKVWLFNAISSCQTKDEKNSR